MSTAHWQQRGFKAGEGAGAGRKGLFQVLVSPARKRAAIRLLGLSVPPQCGQPSPCDSQKLPGTLCRSTCSKFTSTASMTTHKSAPHPPQHTHQVKRPRGRRQFVVTRGPVFGSVSMSRNLTLCPYGERQPLQSWEVTLDPCQMS